MILASGVKDSRIIERPKWEIFHGDLPRTRRLWTLCIEKEGAEGAADISPREGGDFNGYKFLDF
jgi:hypothetical protein